MLFVTTYHGVMGRAHQILSGPELALRLFRQMKARVTSIGAEAGLLIALRCHYSNGRLSLMCSRFVSTYVIAHL